MTQLGAVFRPQLSPEELRSIARLAIDGDKMSVSAGGVGFDRT